MPKSKGKRETTSLTKSTFNYVLSQFLGTEEQKDKEKAHLTKVLSKNIGKHTEKAINNLLNQ